MLGTMFADLGNLGMKRTRLQAAGFYIVYLILVIVVIEILAVSYALLIPTAAENASDIGVGIGTVAAAIACAVLSYVILSQKRLLRQFSSIVYIIIAAALGLLGGGLVGLLLVAYLTTKDAAPVGWR